MKFHIVKKGETMQSIAEKYNMALDELVKMNKQIANPDLIMPGMKIKVPMTHATSTGKKEVEVNAQPERKKDETSVKNAERDKNEKMDQVERKGNESFVENKISVSDRSLEPPHDPDIPKMIPRIDEDEGFFHDKEITAYDDEDEKILDQLVETQQQLYAQPVNWSPTFSDSYSSQNEINEQVEQRGYDMMHDEGHEMMNQQFYYQPFMPAQYTQPISPYGPYSASAVYYGSLSPQPINNEEFYNPNNYTYYQNMWFNPFQYHSQLSGCQAPGYYY
ncbi:LysM peptidoglycan-binding domain-containing protein [Bacillaceae bacterium W0354]